MSSSILYMIPVPIAEDRIDTLPAEVSEVTASLRHYFVENVRTARRFLRSLHASLVIDEISFSEIDKHSGADFNTLKSWLKAGHKIGVLSESGCPGIADPGAELAAIAQSMGANVVPLTGPSSLMLALMASGLNGQCFSFNGYLPVKEPARSKQLIALELISQKENRTQLFIETPYRNNNILEDFLKNCKPGTRICIAQNIGGANAFIKTKTIADWKKSKPTLEKSPAVFLMLA